MERVCVMPVGWIPLGGRLLPWPRSGYGAALRSGDPFQTVVRYSCGRWRGGAWQRCGVVRPAAMW